MFEGCWVIRRSKNCQKRFHSWKNLLLHIFGTPYSFCLTKGTNITSFHQSPSLARHLPPLTIYLVYHSLFHGLHAAPLSNPLQRAKGRYVTLPKAQRTCPKLLFCSWASFGTQKSIELWQHNFFKACTFPSVMIFGMEVLHLNLWRIDHMIRNRPLCPDRL